MEPGWHQGVKVPLPCSSGSGNGPRMKLAVRHHVQGSYGGAGIFIHKYESSKCCMPPDPPIVGMHAFCACYYHLLPSSSQNPVWNPARHFAWLASNDYALIEHASCLCYSAHVHNYSYFNSVWLDSWYTSKLFIKYQYSIYLTTWLPAS